MIEKRRATLLVGLMFLGLAVVIWAKPAADEESAAPSGPTLRQVRVAAIERVEAAREVRFPGVTRATRRAALAFTLPARLAERPVEIGDRVRAGQVLARLEGDEYRLAEQSAAAAVAELEVRLAQAERDEARVTRLAEARAATAEELEQTTAATAAIRAAHDAASARLAETRRRRGETALTAPFDGTVTAVRLEPGEWASPGAPVVEIAGSGGVEVRVEVPETVRPDLVAGAPVRVELPMIGRTVAGRVISIAEAATGTGGLFPVIVELETEPGLVSGLAAEVVLPLERRAELAVPLGAVLDSGSSRPSVFRIADGVASRVAIVPGRLIGDRLTFRSDQLFEGDLVAVVGQTALVEGDRVEVR